MNVNNYDFKLNQIMLRPLCTVHPLPPCDPHSTLHPPLYYIFYIYLFITFVALHQKFNYGKLRISNTPCIYQSAAVCPNNVQGVPLVSRVSHQCTGFPTSVQAVPLAYRVSQQCTGCPTSYRVSNQLQGVQLVYRVSQQCTGCPTSVQVFHKCTVCPKKIQIVYRRSR